MFKRFLTLSLHLTILFPNVWALAETDHAHHHAESPEHHHSAQDHQPAEKPFFRHEVPEHVHDEQEHHAPNQVRLSQRQRLNAGILVAQPSSVDTSSFIEAPGEIRLNTYATSQVTPRIQAQVVERHAKLGDRVKTGQALVTLSSIAMAEAQGAVLEADNEWRRVKQLGRKVVSERRYQEAQINLQLARARLLAYGMPKTQIDRLTEGNRIERADGRFTLLSPQAGTVIRDPFFMGQMVEPGALLFEISDETKLWVEARVTPDALTHIERDSIAQVKIGERWIEGRVIQEYHALDETTRTLAVRLEIANPGDRLHPGQFVTVRIPAHRPNRSGLSLPPDALMRGTDGDWLVYLELSPDLFRPQEVRLIERSAKQVIIEGLEPHQRVVIRGAFFVHSQLAKAGFEIHNH